MSAKLGEFSFACERCCFYGERQYHNANNNKERVACQSLNANF